MRRLWAQPVLVGEKRIRSGGGVWTLGTRGEVDVGSVVGMMESEEMCSGTGAIARLETVNVSPPSGALNGPFDRSGGRERALPPARSTRCRSGAGEQHGRTCSWRRFCHRSRHRTRS